MTRLSSSAGALIVDKGYDANDLAAFLGRQEMEALIPPRFNCPGTHPYD